MTILIVGGTWNREFNNSTESYGKPSSLVTKLSNALTTYGLVDVYNGGRYDKLENIIKSASSYDVVFWWANVDNSLPKIRNVKEIAPYTMLINSKRDDEDKYSFQELIQRSLAAKANLTWKFKKIADKTFETTIFDPLGSVWYLGTDFDAAIKACMDRLIFLKNMTRQQTTKSDTSKGLVMSWYFDQFKQPEYKSEKSVTIPDEQDFVDAVRKYAIEFQKFMPIDCKTERFVGNASLRPILPPQVGRCGKGMPSFRGTDNMIFVSKRNIDKQFITLDNFVPVYMDNDKLMYCGEDKPSVDTPVQIRLYKELDHINYILHSHCYIKNAPFTHEAIPCGAIEEFDEVMKLIQEQKIDNHRNQYFVNLIGHGSIIMWNNMQQFHEDIEPKLEYYKRDMPEIMYKL